MDEFSLKRREIEGQLSRDESRLTALRQSLEKSDQLTGNMVTILESFTVRLRKLDETIEPVYKQTVMLTRLQDNVDKTLKQMNRVIGYHHVTDEVEPRVAAGPAGDIEGYLRVLDRLKEAADFFNSNNPTSVELSHVNEMFDTGIHSLQTEFLGMLQRHSKPVPLVLQTDIAAAEDPEDIPMLELLPVKTVLDLRHIADYLLTNGSHTDILSVYAQIRSTHLGRSLNLLREASQSMHLQTANVPRKASSLAVQIFMKSQSPAKKIMKRGSELALGRRVEGDSVPTVDDPLDGCSAFISAATVFLRLIQSEVRLMQQIISPSYHFQVLDSLTSKSVEFFLKDWEALHFSARRCFSRHEYTIVLSCFRIVRHMQTLMAEYKEVLTGLGSNPFDRFQSMNEAFERTSAKALEDYTQYIRGDPEKQSNLPKDGTVHALTSSTLWFVEQLLEFSRITGDVLLGQSSFAVRTSETERRKSLGQYFAQMLDALNLNMENKARSYESPFVAALFLMNNYHFIRKTFMREGNEHLLQLLEIVFPEVDDHYSTLIASHARAYQRGFTKLITCLGQDHSMTVTGEKISKQARQILKDKFKGFNTELEELHRIQHHWSIPDPQLRSRMRDDNCEVVVPLYTEFYKVYSRRNFTKNPEKYLKYTPDTLEDCLKSFFDGGAP